MYIKPIDSFTEEIVEQEWDAVAAFRDDVIRDGRDISLIDVTEPFVLESVSSDGIKTVLDCGCGTGHLSYLMAVKLGKKVTGIDISGKSIQVAKENYESCSDVIFIKTSIKQFATQHESYDACIANMVMMDLADMKSNLEAIYQMLKPGGLFCFTITHPCFWPIYVKYFDEPWFQYNKEIYITAPFYVNNYFIGHTTHVHRPLSKYVSLCKDTGFQLMVQKELYPQSSHLELNYEYKYPRFLGFVYRKVEK